MIVSVNDQVITFAIAIAIGMSLGVLYDIIRIFRRTIKHSNIIINIEDFMYWVMFGIVVFLVLYSKNYGQIRFFCIIGIALGILIYFLLLSHYIIVVSVKVIDIIKKILLLFFRIIFTPIKILVKIIITPFILFGRLMKKVYGKTLTKIVKNVNMKSSNLKNRIKKSINIILKKI